MQADDRIRSLDRVVYRELTDGEAVLLDLETGGYFGLNRVGSVVWKQMGDGVALSELVERVRGEMLDAPAGLEGDIIAFLGQLLERRLVEIDQSDGV